MFTHIQHRRDTISGWAANNIAPAAGELCVIYYDSDAAQYGDLAGTVLGIKLGDGVTLFSNLLLLRPDGPIVSSGAHRDLSGYNTIANSSNVQETFMSTRELVLKMYQPYSPPTIAFSGSGNTLREVGSSGPVVLTLDNIVAGTNTLREKKIMDLDSNATLQLVAPASGQSTVNTNAVTHNLSALTSTTAGLRRFLGSVTNTRPGPLGNDTVQAGFNYSFVYPMAMGFTATDPRTLTPAQLNQLFFGSGASFGQFLSGAKHLAGSPDGAYAVFLQPWDYVPLSGITQGGTSTPLLGTFDILDKTLSQQSGAPLGGAWSNVRYRVYAQKLSSGGGSPTWYDFV